MSKSTRDLAITCGVVLAAALVHVWLRHLMGVLAPFTPFYISVVVGAWLGGSRPALIATIFSLFIYGVFFAAPIYQEGLGDSIITFLVYALVCLSISFFGEAIHREKRTALAEAGRSRIAEERSLRAQRAAKVGVWESDLVKGTCYFSPEFRRIYGIGDQEFTVEQAFGLIHPAESEREKARFQQAIAEHVEDWESTTRFIHPDLGVRYQYGRAKIDYDGNGRAVRMSGTSMDVTEQYAAEERSSRAQEVAQAGTWELDLTNGKAYLSPEYCRLIGIPHRPIFDLDEMFVHVYADDQDAVRRTFQKTLSERSTSYSVEHRHMLPNGRIRWRLSRGRVIYENGGPVSLVGATIDVTERKQAELALYRSEERFRLATEAINGMVYDHDMQSGTVQRSDGLFTLLGIHAADADPSETWWTSRIHADDLILVGPMVEQVLAERQELFDLEYRVRNAQGDWVWVNDKGRCTYDAHGRPARVVGCTMDITVRKKAEVELQEADRRKDEFLATLAHELRNPLSPLQHAVDLLDVVAEDRHAVTELRAMMERQMRHIVRLIDDLMDLSRISRGKIELRKREVDLRACVQTAVEANKYLIDRSEHDLVVDLPDVDCLVDGDHERLTQVVSNLLNNAAKFTPPQGRIVIQLKEEGDEAVLTVEDNGPGLKQEALERIFDMFVQAGERLRAGTSNGLGIGLNLVRRLVTMHNGTVTAESEGIGRGARFSVRIPLVPADGTTPSGHPDQLRSDIISA